MTDLATDPTAPTASARPTATSARRTVLVTCAATFLVLADYTAPLVTVPETAAALGASPAAQTWLIAAISLGLAALLLVAGALADDHGRRRIFVLGTAGFAVTTAIGALASDAPTFIAARVLQGATGAAVLATSLGLIAAALPPGPDRIRATGRWGATVGLGIALGPLVSAAGTTLGGWRLSYLALAVPAAALAPLAHRTLTESRAATRRPLDLPGALLFTTAVTAVLVTVTEGRDGWGRPVLLLPAAVALLALTAFTLVELRRPHPMVDLRLLRSGPFLAAVVGGLFTGVSVVGLMSYLPTVLQRAVGYTPLETAWMFGLWSGLSVLASLRAHLLAHRLASHQLLATALALCAAGHLALLGAVGSGSTLRLLAGMAVGGVGIGLANAANARLAVESVPADRSAMGSGANNTARYTGAALGVAVTVAVVAAAPGATTPAEALATGADAALLVAAALALLGAAIVLLAGARRPPRTDHARRTGEPG
ncbi:MFS transporter [Allostreptomyces psammosilenae]|uniref:MFS family permease n=1 Tax=Allostreptomyces psammosilenae TaxID=1892865 RepID=A0A853A0H6_9ACTN|nr:MFS transporter [Allostreptomyces psammosilenae]NYI06434.1 MFS family permease [Allostreptomyces psammosilenae]